MAGGSVLGFSQVPSEFSKTNNYWSIVVKSLRINISKFSFLTLATKSQEAVSFISKLLLLQFDLFITAARLEIKSVEAVGLNL